MALSIRLQNHGHRNHPFWWIVVAPKYKNIFGRYVEHVGYWTPHHGINMERQIALNIPRVKYWIASGAVPSPKVHRFLSYWDILPTPWFHQKTPEEIAAIPEKQLTERQQRKKQRSIKQKEREARGEQPVSLYHPHEANAKQIDSFRKKLLSLLEAQQMENQILRQIVISNDYQRYCEINKLTNNDTTSHARVYRELKAKLNELRSQLSSIEHEHSSNPLSLIKAAKSINGVSFKMREIQKLNASVDLSALKDGESEYMTESLMRNMLRRELMRKKLVQLNEEIQVFNQNDRPATLEEIAEHLIAKRKMKPEAAVEKAKNIVGSLNRSKKRLTRNDLNYGMLEFRDELLQKKTNPKHYSLYRTIRDNLLNPMGNLPIRKPVHPFPDLETYVPEQYYEPIKNSNLQKVNYPTLEPHEELEKYKRATSAPVSAKRSK